MNHFFWNLDISKIATPFQGCCFLAPSYGLFEAQVSFFSSFVVVVVVAGGGGGGGLFSGYIARRQGVLTQGFSCLQSKASAGRLDGYIPARCEDACHVGLDEY